MTSALVFQTLRGQRGMLIGFCGGLFAWGMIITAIYPTFQVIEDLNKIFESYPKYILAFVGPLQDLTTVEGFLSVEFFAWTPLLIGVYCIISGVRAIAGEERNQTMDLLLGTPLARWQLVAGKFAAMAVGVAMILASGLLGILAGVPFLGELEYRLIPIALAAVNVLPVCLATGGIAFALTAWMSSRRSAGSLTAVVLIASYILDSLARISAPLQKIEWLSYYHYYGGGVLKDGFEGSDVAILLGFSAALFGLALVGFQRRDIAS